MTKGTLRISWVIHEEACSRYDLSSTAQRSGQAAIWDPYNGPRDPMEGAGRSNKRHFDIDYIDLTMIRRPDDR